MRNYVGMRPMLATPGPLPTGPEWAFECKWDGIRLLAETGRGERGLRLTTRNEKDWTDQLTELSGLRDLPAGWVFDGEYLNGQGYVVFDVLAVAGEATIDLPYRARQQLLAEAPLVKPMTVCESFADGQALWEATATQGLEGVVAKRLDSRYTPNTRSKDWVKVVHRHRDEFVIVGWRETNNQVVSIALATATGQFRGSVGAGLSARVNKELKPLLHAPVDQAHPAIPADFQPADGTVVVEVEYREIGASGSLRHPSLKRLRPDKAPS